MLGLAGGAALGTMARLGDWFAPDPERIIARWDRWRAILPPDDVVRRVYERTLTDPYRVNRPAPPPTTQGSEVVLDGAPLCRPVVARADRLGLEDLKTALRDNHVPWAAAVTPIQDVAMLRDVAKDLCTWEASLRR
ncbi:MAG TPA: hypothetical protein VF516_04170 [Kofleriaceae bacterium]